MQLISIESNRSSFRPVVFKNQSGLNFILAKQSKLVSKVDDKTFNGVGKSLLIALVHFCLGSSTKDSFKKHLPGWVFTLKFAIDTVEYTAIRATDNQTKINLNGVDIKVADFNSKFGRLIFDIPDDVGQLSFRSLLPFFIRPRRGSYNSFKDPNVLNNEYPILFTNSFLLGLNVHLVEEKFKLRKEKERIKNLVKELTNDHLLKEFFIGNRDVSLAKQDLEDKIKSLDSDLQKFQIAEDYYDIKREADRLQKDLEATQNKIVLIQNQILNIEESRKISPDIKKESIERIYKEASIILAEGALLRLEELEKFYKHLTINREKRLLDQKNALLRESKELNTHFDNLKTDFDKNLSYLNSHQALDVFVKLTNKLSDLKSEKDNLERYDTLLKEYHNSKLKIEKDFLDATVKTDEYLNEAEGVVKGLRDFFRELTKRFYPNSAAGITVYNNVGDNQIRYTFDAKVEADASDGINSVKIFCYDLTILLQGFGHKMNMIFHDSRLLDGIDPRQVAELFKTLKAYVPTANKQYILSINQNHLDEIKQHLTPEEFKEIVLDNICHELEDDSPSSKLLGIQVDMAYN